MSLQTFASVPVEQQTPSNSGRLLLTLPVLLEIIASSVVLITWIKLAFVPGHSLVLSSSAILFASLVMAGVIAFLIQTLPLAGDTTQALAIQGNLARCSLSSLIVLIFFPEYLARVQPPLARSYLVLAIVTTLWFLLSAMCILHGRRRRLSDLRVQQIAVSMLLILFSAVTEIAIRKYLVFGYVGQDLAYFAQIMHTTLEGHLFWGNLLQDVIYSRAVTTDFAGHNSPVMFLFLPFYAIFPSPITLIVLRNAVLIAAAIPVFLIARCHVSVTSACLWSTAFLVTPAILYQTTFDFYPLTFVVLPLIFTVYFYLNNRYIAFWIALLATLLVREDLSLFAIGMGLLALVQKKSARWSVLPIVAGLSWAAISFLVVLPAALKGATFVTDTCFTHLGNNPTAMVRDVLLHPRSNVLVHGNLVYLKTLFTPTALFLFLGSPVSLLCVPFVGINLLAGAGRCITTVIYAQYSVIPATILYLGAMLGILHGGRYKYLALWAHLGLPSSAAAPLIQIALGCASLVFVTGQMQWDELHQQPWAAEARHVLTLIPADASVAAPRYMLPELANRDCLFQTHRLAQYHNPHYEYLILDSNWKHINAATEFESQYKTLVKEAAANSTFKVLYSSPGYIVYRIPAAAGISCVPDTPQAVHVAYSR